MNIKQLREKRATLLKEVDGATEERFAAIRKEIEKIDFQIASLQTDEQSVATEERAADIAAAARPVTGGNQNGAADAALRFMFSEQGNQADPQPEKRASDPYDTPEYRSAFMTFCQDGTPIPRNLRGTKLTRADAKTTTTDASAVIPTTITKDIIQKLTSYGNIYAAVTKTNVQGGVKIPILTLKPTATWIGETTTSETKKIKADDSVTFNYYGLECKIAQTLLANVVTLEQFQSLFVPLATEAIVKALETAIVNGTGSGQPLGITKDTRVPAENKIAITEAEFKTWSGWKKKVFAKMKKSYRKGIFIMAQPTFDGYIDGMVDTTGQPIGRVNYGIDGGENYRFGGKTVETVEDELIPAYDDAAAGDIVAIFIDLKNYAINSNLEMTTVKWIDHDTNEVKNKVILIVDGKLADPYGVLLITKGTAAAGG